MTPPRESGAANRDDCACYTCLTWLAFVMATAVVFARLIYPEIVRASLPTARCTIRDSFTNQTYHCDSCDNMMCSDACSAIMSNITTGKSPILCQQNASYCVPDRVKCSDGAYVCCEVHFSNVAAVTYELAGELINATAMTDFDVNIADAMLFTSKHRANLTIPCWHTSRDIHHVMLVNECSIWKWILFMFLAILSIAPCLCVCARACEACGLCESCDNDTTPPARVPILPRERHPPAYASLQKAAQPSPKESKPSV